MADGTLLGSYFFHDIIPWDDDIDIMVDYRDYPRLKKAFQNHSVWLKYNLYGYQDSFNEYEFDLLDNVYPDTDQVKTTKHKKQITLSNRTRFHKTKIFSTQANKFKKYPWRWPFIDVTFFKYNMTHFWNHDKIQYFMPIEDFFPFYVKISRSEMKNGRTNESAILSGKILYSTYVHENFNDVKLGYK